MLRNLEVIFGPPGTGKTTELAQLTQRDVAEEGSDAVLVCAYTKTAARELAGRETGLGDERVGTLHSHCYHALDTPKIAETFAKEWSDTHPSYPMARQKSLFTPDEPERRGMALHGDECLNEYHLLRHRMVPQDHWPAWVRMFAREWTAWKHETGYVDFTDLIDRARTLVPVAPGHPSTLIIDEAQDLQPAAMGLAQPLGATYDACHCRRRRRSVPAPRHDGLDGDRACGYCTP